MSNEKKFKFRRRSKKGRGEGPGWLAIGARRGGAGLQRWSSDRPDLRKNFLVVVVSAVLLLKFVSKK
ncbi:hypothetical protein IQ07DRAFT_587223 [Pyrenochaeta sp. DS3sAY3a]|nr:hypothetical protein IQ07DRAFT_587223 [Pyrenochaeta sp. DS3sAY3a]